MARTDNDTWDLSTSVGATATMVAAGRARATRDGTIDDKFAEPLVAAVGIDFFTRWAKGELAAADVDVPGQPWGMQMMTDLLATRTPHIDGFVADALAAGVRQVVILAAGLDARSYRLRWPADAVVYEIDQPEVIEFKRSTLADLGAEPTVELRSVPIDLRNDWPTALVEAGFDPSSPSAWLAEGLLAFLPPDAQDRLLANITALSTADSRLVAEIFLATPDSDQLQHAATQLWYKNGLDIKIDDLAYPEHRTDVATYLTEHGWSTTSVRLVDLLVAAGVDVPAGAEGSIADNYYCTAIRQA